jgi:uncharacterized membrane protein YfcA
MEVLMLFLVVGAAAGFIAGLLGVGGGLVVVPALMFVFAAQKLASGVAIPLAFGTSMASVLFTSLSSLRAHHARGAVLWDVWRRITPGIVLGGVAGAALGTVLPGNGLRLALCVYLVLIAAQMLFGMNPRARSEPIGRGGLAVAGSVIGAVSGMVGFGGGVLSIPLLSWSGVHFRQAIGTAAAIGMPIAISATAGYITFGFSSEELPPFSLGYVYLPALAAIVAPSMLLAPLGARCAHRLPVPLLKRALALALLVTATRLAMAH